MARVAEPLLMSAAAGKPNPVMVRRVPPAREPVQQVTAAKQRDICEAAFSRQQEHKLMRLLLLESKIK
jgi:hypothetical protein